MNTLPGHPNAPQAPPVYMQQPGVYPAAPSYPTQQYHIPYGAHQQPTSSGGGAGDMCCGMCCGICIGNICAKCFECCCEMICDC